MISVEFAKKQLERVTNLEALISDLDLVNKAFNEVIFSLYVNTPDVVYGESLIEPLSTKMALATKSILELTKGSSPETATQIGIVVRVDYASINVLARSVIEAFLTAEYLFYNDLSQEERNFRFIIWRLSGYKSRKSFFSGHEDRIPDSVKEKLSDEDNQINSLLEQAKSYPYFDLIKKNDKWKLDAYGIPRLKSWSDLLNESILRSDQFLIPYRQYSNYAHSEFISLIQMQDPDAFNKGTDINSLHLKNALHTVLCINCVAIDQLSYKFKNTREAYTKLNENQRMLIEFWTMFSTMGF
ncbi:hypothetical protein ACTJIJ_14980 [Niabella sp. 22666]|uniref:hypothetical protein n=1 Tax=Niabella sp. 22666 TaxID=3453954 RepID=UPI003F85202A